MRKSCLGSVVGGPIVGFLNLNRFERRAAKIYISMIIMYNEGEAEWGGWRYLQHYNTKNNKRTLARLQSRININVYTAPFLLSVSFSGGHTKSASASSFTMIASIATILVWPDFALLYRLVFPHTCVSVHTPKRFDKYHDLLCGGAFRGDAVVEREQSRNVSI